MRYLSIFILLTFSALAQSQIAVERMGLTDNELVLADLEPINKWANCIVNTQYVINDVDTRGCMQFASKKLAEYKPSRVGSYYYHSTIGTPDCFVIRESDLGAEIECVVQKKWQTISSTPQIHIDFVKFTAAGNTPFSQSTYKCPPSNNQRYNQGPILKDTEIGTARWCYNINDIGHNHCPEASPNDISVLGVSNKIQQHCFYNPDGTQCKITTDETGSFTKPFEYASQEAVACVADSPQEDPTEDPTPTEDPETPPGASETDNTDDTNELDALNKTNDNLDAINENIVNGNEAKIDRLDQVVDETQNTNKLLADLKDNTYDTASKSADTNTLLKETNGLLKELGDKLGDAQTEPQPCDNPDGCENNGSISVTSNRKTGGLNDLFSSTKLSTLESEATQIQTDLKDYYSQIQSEIKGMFDIQINATGAYEERTMVLKGQSIDYGLGRFATFWQSLGPVVLFVFSCLALYAVLGGVRA